MTLILSFITHKFAVQVSDRRLSKNGRPYNPEPDANKVLLYRGQIAFGYTGQAYFGKVRTDKWLEKILIETYCHSINDVLNAVNKNASTYFGCAFRTKQWPPQAFVALGWTKPVSQSTLQPTICEVSNFDQNDDTISNINPIFKTRIWTLPKTDLFDLRVTGQNLTQNELISLKRTLRRGIQRDVSALSIIILLGNTIRKVAARNPKVGADLMAISLPKDAIGNNPKIGPHGEPVILFGPGLPTPNSITSLYFPENSQTGIIYSPPLVSPGSSTGELTISPLSEADIKALQAPQPLGIVVLTSWAGLGTHSPHYRAAISNDYKLKSCSQMTGGLQQLSKDHPDKYYGCLVQIEAEQEIINQIKKDSKYLIVLEGENQANFIPDESWFLRMKNWFISRGMPVKDVKIFIKTIDKLQHKEVVKELTDLLIKPR